MCVCVCVCVCVSIDPSGGAIMNSNIFLSNMNNLHTVIWFSSLMDFNDMSIY